MRGRRVLIVAAGTAAFLLLAALALWTAAPRLIAAWGERALREAGFAEATIEGVALAPGTLRIARIEFVPEGRVTAEDIRIDFDLAGLHAGRAGGILVRRVVAELDPDFALAGYAPRAAGGGDGLFARFERLDVASLTLSAPTPAGPAEMRLDDLALSPDGDAIPFRGSALLALGEGMLSGQVSGRLSRAGRPLSLRLFLAGTPVTGLSGRIDLALEEDGRARIASSLASPDLSRMFGPRLSGSASVDLALAVDGREPRSGIVGRLAVDARGLALEERILQVSTAFEVDIRSDDGELALQLAKPAVIEGMPAPALLPQAAAGYRGRPLVARIARLAAWISPADRSVVFDAEIGVEAGESRLLLTGERVRARFGGDADRAAGVSGRGLRLAAEKLALGELDAGIEEGRLDFEWSPAAGAEVAGEGVLRLAGSAGMLSVSGLALPVAGRLLAGTQGIGLSAGAGSAPLSLRLDLPSNALDLVGESPQLSFEGAIGGLDVSARGGRLCAPALGWCIEGLDAEAALDAEGPVRATLAVGTIRQEADTPSLVPLSLDIAARRDGEGFSFTGILSDALGIAILEATGGGDSERGEAELRLYPVEFLSGAVEIADLSPRLGRWLVDASGRVAFSGTVGWHSSGVRQTGVLELHDFAAHLPVGAFAGLDAAVRLSSLLPPSTSGTEEITVALLDAGIPLTGGRMRFRLAPDERVEIADMAFSLAGGELSARPFTLDPASTDALSVTLQARDLDVERLLRMADLEGVSGTGRLSGEIPLVLSADGVRIKKGGLSTSTPGVLRYAPAEPPAFMRGDEPRARMLREALEDFRYDALRLEISGDLATAQSVTLFARGRNPGFQDGRPVELDFTFSGAVLGALRTVGMRVAPRR